MIDFPIADLLDEEECARWLEQRLNPDGLHCPGCHSDRRRIAERHRFWTAYRCKACDRYYTLLTGTIFEKTRQPPSKLVLLLRGIAKGEPTARLARELGIGRVRLHELRKGIQHQLFAGRRREPLPDGVLEADELYQNAGEKKHSAP